MGKVIVDANHLAANHSPDELQEALRIQHEKAKAKLEQAKAELKKTSVNPNAGRKRGTTKRCSCGMHTAKAAAQARLACRLDRVAKR